MPQPRRTAKKPRRFLETPSSESTPEHDEHDDTATEMSQILSTLQAMQGKIDQLERGKTVELNQTPVQSDKSADSSSDNEVTGAMLRTPRGRKKLRERTTGKKRRRSPSPSPKHKRRRTPSPKRRRSPSPSSSSEKSGETSSDDKSDTLSDSDTTDFEDYDKPQTSFGSIVGATVTEKNKQTILSDKFIEMAELLPNFKTHKQLKDYKLTEDTDHTLKYVKARPKYDINFGQWCGGFVTYTAVYVERAKTRSGMLKLIRSMLTYTRKLSEIKKKQYDWAAYDRHFRTERETGKESWVTTRQDLLTMYQAPPHDSFRQNKKSSYANGNQNKTTANNKTGGGSIQTKDGATIPSGYCINFHSRGQRCTTVDCGFLHQCPKCKSRHPIFICGTSPAHPNNTRSYNNDNKQQSHYNKGPNTTGK